MNPIIPNVSNSTGETPSPMLNGPFGWNSNSPTGYGSSESSSGSDPKLNYGSWNGDWRSYLEYMASHGDQASLDRLLSYLMSEQSALTAREWTANREDTAYQRLVADMKASGLNPYAFATMGVSPISSSSSGHTYNSNAAASYEINKEKNEQNWLKIALQGFLPVIGAIIAALL